MKLKFLLQKNAWFIEHERSWYAVSDEEHRRIAAGALPLTVVDEHALIEQPHVAGEARLTEETRREAGRLFGRDRELGTVRVTLVEPDGTPVVEQRVQLDVSVLASVDWLTPPFRDGWLDASASLSLDNVERLELQVFLPGAAGSNGKELIVHNRGDGSSSRVWLARDTTNVVPLVAGGGTVVLHLECEPEAGSDDSRRLGFVLVGESIAAT